MDLQAYRDEIKLKLSGNVLDLELDDPAIDKLIDAAFRETQRYIDTTRLATIPYSPCIDLSKCGVSAVVRIYRAQGYLGDSQNSGDKTSWVDPIQATQWQMLSGVGNMGNIQNWIYNYSSWNTMLQIRNTLSTDLAFKYDKHDNKLYINVGFDKPEYITIEYIPFYKDATEVVSDYWIDIIVRIAVALTKIALGRVRNRFTQSNALWEQDGATLLDEGNTELAELRETLRANSQMFYPID